MYKPIAVVFINGVTAPVVVVSVNGVTASVVVVFINGVTASVVVVVMIDDRHAHVVQYCVFTDGPQQSPPSKLQFALFNSS